MYIVRYSLHGHVHEAAVSGDQLAGLLTVFDRSPVVEAYKVSTSLGPQKPHPAHKKWVQQFSWEPAEA